MGVGNAAAAAAVGEGGPNCCMGEYGIRVRVARLYVGLKGLVGAEELFDVIDENVVVVDVVESVENRARGAMSWLRSWPAVPTPAPAPAGGIPAPRWL